jgi:O-antigen/teichoic acid export membrane protein
MAGAPQSADTPQDSSISHLEFPHPWRVPDLTRRLDLRARIDWARGFIGRARSDSLLRNGVFSTATQVVNSAFGYVFWLLAAHSYSPATVGLTAAATSATSIVLMLSCLGVGGMLIQSLPRQAKETEWSATFWAGIATVTLIAAALCGAGVAVLPLISPELAALRGVGFAAVFAVGAVALTVGTTLDCVFLAERRANYAFTRNFVVGAVKVLMLGLLALAFGPDAVRLLGAWGVAAAVGLGTGVALLVRHIGVARPPGLSVLLRTARGFRSRVTLHQLIGLGAGLLTYLLPLIVTVRLSARENAYFYTTWMLAALFLVIAPSFSNNLFAEGMHRPEELGALARSAFKIMSAIMLPGLVAILVLGGTLLSAFGHAYSGHSVGLLRLVVLASIPDAVVHVYVGVLRAEARLAAAASLLVGIGIGTVVISWFLLPLIGISAVGYAFLAMQVCGCAYVVLDWRRRVSGARVHGDREIR